mgnify:CR=1 FL=1
MRMSKFYMPTLKENPAEAEIASHKLLLRSGMIRKSASGIYSYLPLGYRVVRKIENIVREEMDRFGAQEILMSAIQPKEIWEESKRWYTFGPEMFKVKDRNEREFCLGPTAEEYFTVLIKGEINSYKQLPLNIYQIQTKYRDEKRPRFGINRAREFLMKDAYSFDKDISGMEKAYMNMWKAYEAVFNRLKLNYRIVQGDSGAMGGNSSHEFIALSDTGEGIICYCDESGYAATDEKAKVVYEVDKSGEMSETEKVSTPDMKTIEEVSNFLKVESFRCAKAVNLKVESKPVVVLIPGNRELNFAKLSAYLKVPEHEIAMMNDEEILNMNSYPGFTGPLNLNEDVRIIADRRVTEIKNLIVGGNEKDIHIKNVNYKRDFEGEIAEDLLMIEKYDKCPLSSNELKFARGIEVGNIFQLGTKYSESLNVKFLDEDGKEKYFYMGSYGIGITRSVSAIVEQNNDEKGIVWPMSVTPYQVIITVINMKDEKQSELGEKLYNEFLKKGVEVLFDDRNERPGVKFADRDLIGIPVRITVGKKAGEGIVEYSLRKDGENFEIGFEEAVSKTYLKIKEEI